MSKTFDDFMQQLQQDPELAQELRSRFGNSGTGVPADQLAAFAASKGYRFEVSDTGGELSDAELSGIAGGAIYIKFDGVDGESTRKDHKG